MADEKLDRPAENQTLLDPSRREFVTTVVAGLAVAASAGFGRRTAGRRNERRGEDPRRRRATPRSFIPPPDRIPACSSGPTRSACARRCATSASGIAAEGYSVLVPNPFYRVAKAPVIDGSVEVQLLEPDRHGEAAAADGRRSTRRARPKRTRWRSSRSSTRSRR